MNSNPLFSSVRKVAVALTLAAALTSVTHAAETPATRAVTYADLDLTRASDAETLYARLRTAANTVCRQQSSYSLHRKRVRDACVTQTLDKAVAAVNHSAVLALHQARRGERLASTQRSTTPRG